MIRVLHLIKSLGRGGAEVLLTETLALHDKQRFAWQYAYFLPWKNQLVDALEVAGGAVSNIPARNNLQIIARAQTVAEFVRNNKVDLLHCHLPWAGICGRIAARIHRVPLVYTEHNTQERYNPLTRWANVLTLGWNTRVLAVSDEVASSIKRYKGPKFPVVVVRNGVDLRRYDSVLVDVATAKRDLGIDSESLVIGTVCVFRRQKRLKTWLEIAARLLADRPALRFLLVGDGPLMPQVKDWIRETGLEDRVLLPGLRVDVRPYLSAMDLFMMTSEFEGMPIAMLEAMAMGKAVIATNAGGVREVIEQGESGFLVDVARPHDLVEVGKRLLRDPELRNRVGSQARLRVEEHFSLQRMVRDLESIYAELSPAGA